MTRNIWWPDADIGARVERLKRQRAERCAAGMHDDPENSGACILCGADLDALRALDGRED